MRFTRAHLKGHLKALVVVAPLLLISGVVLASGGDNECAEGLNDACIKAIGVHTLNFVLLFGFLIFMTRKAISEALRQRQAGVRQEIDNANATHKAAQLRFDELEARLARFEQEVERMTAAAKVASDRDHALHRERTAIDIELIKDQATRAIREEGSRAHRALRKQAVDLAISVATESLRAQLKDSDHARLNQDFLVAVNPGVADA